MHRDTKLITHMGATKVDRQFLAEIETPPATDTFQPIPHKVLVDAVEESLAFRHIHLERSEFALSKDGHKMFGLLEVNQVYEGVQFAIGLRNSNDKSMSLAMTAGYRVFVCDNMALSGDFYPLKAKHTKHLDLVESVSMGIDRIQRNWGPLRAAIDFKRSFVFPPENARLLIYDSFVKKGLPISMFKAVASDFETGDYFTLWDIENIYTNHFKQLKPVAQYQATARLGKIISNINVLSHDEPFIDVIPTEPSADELN